MSFSSVFECVRRPRLAIIAGLAMVLGVSAAVPAQAHVIVVTVHRVKAVNKIDYGSQADFYAKVTIAGEKQQSGVTKSQNDIRPGWKFTKVVPPGKHDVIVEIWDKDIAINDQVDINRVANRRKLLVNINTRSCRISKISGGYGCRDRIVRAGKERKSAEVTFSIDVR